MGNRTASRPLSFVIIAGIGFSHSYITTCDCFIFYYCSFEFSLFPSLKRMFQEARDDVWFIVLFSAPHTVPVTSVNQYISVR